MIEHEMTYRAGRSGFASVGLPDAEPGWHCSCALGWSFAARAMPSRRSGNNLIEAQRAHRAHVEART